MIVSNQLHLTQHLLKFFTVKEITRLETVCKGWREFIYQIYTNAERLQRAFPHYSIQAGVSLHKQNKYLHRIPFNISRGICSILDVEAESEPRTPLNLLTPQYEIHRHPNYTLTFTDRQTGTSTVCPGHSDPLDPDMSFRIIDMQLTPDGECLVTAATDNTLKWWELATGNLLHTFTCHNHWIRAVQMRPKENSFVSIDDRGTIKEWNLATGQETKKMITHLQSVSVFELSLNQNQLFVSSPYSRGIRVIDLVRKKQSTIQLIETIGSIVFTPDQKMMIAGGKRALYIWDLQEELPTILHTIPLPHGIVHKTNDDSWRLGSVGWMKFSDDGAQLILRDTFISDAGEHELSPFANVIDFLNLSDQEARIAFSWRDV